MAMRLALEEVKFLQKQKERKSGIPAIPSLRTTGVTVKLSDKNDGDGEKEELVLQDTFAQETAVTDLAKELLDTFTAKQMGKVFFTNSGSEANDS
ncbi:hypothetical protein Syun_020688 [Stephania yunnanensis]|uniref:Uncharacterized protein n=1 Tax=Stephania yunnanensis TaxID=152371 RepID=A0AAP0NRN5_9MAGN